MGFNEIGNILRFCYNKFINDNIIKITITCPKSNAIPSPTL